MHSAKKDKKPQNDGIRTGMAATTSSNATTRESPCRGGPLTLEALLFLLPLDASPESLKALQLNDLGVTELPKQIRLFKAVRKVDASRNALTSLEPFSTLAQLTQLNVANNVIRGSLSSLMPLTQLTVLNISSNRISSLRGLEACESLKALIATDNRISLKYPAPESVSSSSPSTAEAEENYKILASLQGIETVVLSRNPMGDVSGKSPDAPSRMAMESSVTTTSESTTSTVPHMLSCFAELPNLKKLSLSECGITSLPKRWFLRAATEIRLAHNHIQEIPEAVILRSVHTLDVSGNALTDIVQLRRCKFLQHLNVKGNPLTCSGSGTGSTEVATEASLWWKLSSRMHMILGRMFEQLKTVDGAKFDALSKEAYLAVKQAELHKDSPLDEEPITSTSSRKAAVKRARDEPRREDDTKVAAAAVREETLPDVVLDPPTVASKGRGAVVRRERAVAQQVIQKNTKAVGRSAMDLLKERHETPTNGW